MFETFTTIVADGEAGLAGVVQEAARRLLTKREKRVGIYMTNAGDFGERSWPEVVHLIAAMSPPETLITSHGETLVLLSR